MGYYTSYNLSIKGIKTEDEYNAVAEKLKDLHILGYALEEDLFDPKYSTQYFVCYDVAKWSEYDEDMKEVSKAFPTFTFQLHGEGQESNDIWDSYYYNGESEYCPVKIIYQHPETISWED